MAVSPCTRSFLSLNAAGEECVGLKGRLRDHLQLPVDSLAEPTGTQAFIESWTTSERHASGKLKAEECLGSVIGLAGEARPWRRSLRSLNAYQSSSARSNAGQRAGVASSASGRLAGAAIGLVSGTVRHP